MPHPILLYDGICGLCNRFVQFVMQRDPRGVFRFASLQSEIAGRILQGHKADSSELGSMYVVIDYELASERMLARSDALIFVLKQLAAAAELRSAEQPGTCPEPAEGAAVPTQTKPLRTRLRLCRVAATLLLLIPGRVRDWGYRVVARHRYRIFGRHESCLLPAPRERHRFLDM